jgi:hypothetical protein
MPAADFTPLPANHAKPFAPATGETGKLVASIAIYLFSGIRGWSALFQTTKSSIGEHFDS